MLTLKELQLVLDASVKFLTRICVNQLMANKHSKESLSWCWEKNSAIFGFSYQCSNVLLCQGTQTITVCPRTSVVSTHDTTVEPELGGCPQDETNFH